MSNNSIDPANILLNAFYYRSIKNRNIKIRCLDTYYFGGTKINIVSDNYYSVLKATNKLSSCIFIFHFEYDLNESNKKQHKSIEYAFKVVSEKEFKMYSDMETIAKAKAKVPKIVRPQKIKD